MGNDSDGTDEAIRKSSVKLRTLDYDAWFPISDALLLLANEISPDQVNKKLLCSAPQSELFRAAKRELIGILGSGEVSAQIEGKNGMADLERARIRHVAFQIVFAKNEVLVEGSSDLNFYCEVNRVELEAFLNRMRKERASWTPTQIKWANCRSWLEELTLGPKDRTKSVCMLYAEAEFGVSQTAFNRIWKEITAYPDRKHWRRPGRPSVENPWENPTPSD